MIYTWREVSEKTFLGQNYELNPRRKGRSSKIERGVRGLMHSGKICPYWDFFSWSGTRSSFLIESISTEFSELECRLACLLFDDCQFQREYLPRIDLIDLLLCDILKTFAGVSSRGKRRRAGDQHQ